MDDILHVLQALVATHHHGQGQGRCAMHYIHTITIILS